MSKPRILILTPVKDAANHLDGYLSRIASLTYPRDALSIGVLEGDSRDKTWTMLQDSRDRMEQITPRVTLVKKDFGFKLPPGVPRWSPGYQLTRRSILARARNHLLLRALHDEDWVLWLDVDVIRYPENLIEQLLGHERDIIHPHCVLKPGGATFDTNGWAAHGQMHMHDMRGAAGPVRLDSVGGTVLMIRADIHRDGLIFPPFRYGVGSEVIRPAHPVWGKGEIETEGLAAMARDMGHQCWGLPDLEVLHEND